MLPVVPIVALIAAYHRSTVILTTARWTNPYFVPKFVLKFGREVKI